MHQFLLPLLILTTSWVTAQTENQVRFGAPYPSIKSTQKHFIVDETARALIVLKEPVRSKKRQENTPNIAIHVFNLNTLHPTRHQDQVLLPNGSTVLAPLHFHHKTYLFYRNNKETPNDKRLFAQIIDSKTADLAGDPIRLIGNEQLYDYSLTQSPDKKTVLIQGFKTLDHRDDKLQLGFYSFGKDLQALTQTMVELPYAQKQATIYDFCVDNQGIPYLLLKVYHQKSGEKRDVTKTKVAGKWRKQNEINYHIELLTINPKDGSFTIHKILLDKRLPNDFHLEASPNNRVYCAGYYTDKNSKEGGARGLFVWELEPQTGVLRERYYPIPLEVLTQYEQAEVQRAQAKAGLKGEAEVEGLELNTLQFQTDGSVLVNAAGFRSVTRSYLSNGQLNSYRVYLYQDIFVTKINSDGTIAWINKIPKNQQSLRPTSKLGYTYFKDSNYHYYLHMDHLKNDRLGKFDVPKVYKDGEYGTVTVAVLNQETGELTRKRLISTKKQLNRQGYRLSNLSHQHIVPISSGKAVMEFDIDRKQNVLMEVDMKE